MYNPEELLKLPRLGKDDTFAFGCNRCGSCCRERDDILLTPLDLFKISKYLKKSIQEVLISYCESYEGSASKIPIVRLKPREYRRTCPFAGKDGCMVHPVKPIVCSLYPLGRMTDPNANQFTYILQPITCGNKNQTQTVKQWLEGFSVLDEEKINLYWHSQVMRLTIILNKIYDEYPIDHDPINHMLLMNLYVFYDLERNFMLQFKDNCDAAICLVQEISKRLGESTDGCNG